MQDGVRDTNSRDWDNFDDDFKITSELPPSPGPTSPSSIAIKVRNPINESEEDIEGTFNFISRQGKPYKRPRNVSN